MVLNTVDDGGCVYDPVPSTAECVTSVEFDNYTYPVVAVGPRCWFAEELRTPYTKTVAPSRKKQLQISPT